MKSECGMQLGVSALVVRLVLACTVIPKACVLQLFRFLSNQPGIPIRFQNT